AVEDADGSKDRKRPSRFVSAGSCRFRCIFMAEGGRRTRRQKHDRRGRGEAKRAGNGKGGPPRDQRHQKGRRGRKDHLSDIACKIVAAEGLERARSGESPRYER